MYENDDGICKQSTKNSHVYIYVQLLLYKTKTLMSNYCNRNENPRELIIYSSPVARVNGRRLRCMSTSDFF